LAAVPSAGRAARVERPSAPVSDATCNLYERFAGQIFGYCLHQLGSREEAEDAVQTTFMNAFRGLQRGIVPQVESAWLFKIAHNVCLSRRRSTRRRGNVEAPNNFEVLQEVVPARERGGDELMRLQDVLEQMPETQRRAILLREWQGLSYREIAQELDVSQSAVETLIFRARRSLASGLDAQPTWRRRARHGFDAGTVAASLKGLLSLGTAAKVAATIAVATTAAVAVSEADHGVAPRPAVPATHATHVTPANALRSVPTTMTAATTRPVDAPRAAQRRLSHHALASHPVHASRASAAAPIVARLSPFHGASPTAKHEHAVARMGGVAKHGFAKGHAKREQEHVRPVHGAPPSPQSQPSQPSGSDQQGGGGGHGNGHGDG
jgi:RNA polymerase sigma factor (sigma-70 family)